MLTDRRQKTIVLADDDEYINDVYSFGLTRAGFTVISVKNGKEALEKAREIMPDLIILDQMMPIMSGSQAIEEIRKDEALKQIPVFLFTNLEQQTDTEQQATFNTCEHLGKCIHFVKSEIAINDIVDKAIRCIADES